MTAAARILLTEDQAAQVLHLSARTLRGLRAKGMIRYIRPSPRKVLYATESRNIPEPQDVKEANSMEKRA